MIFVDSSVDRESDWKKIVRIISYELHDAAPIFILWGRYFYLLSSKWPIFWLRYKTL